jgi:hypothetical protein
MEGTTGTCGHRCPQHPDWTPCQLAPGHSLVIGHRDSAGPDVSHVWQDSGHSGDYAAEDTRAIFGAAADAFETGPMGVSPSA